MSSATPNPYNWKFALISQTYLVVISIVLGFYPKYFLEAFISYFIIIMAITFSMTYKSNPMLRDRKLMMEVANSGTLYEEKNANDLVMKDEEYQREYMQFAKKNMTMLFSYLIYIVVLFFVYSYVSKIATSQTDPYYRLAVYLVYFEIIYLFGFFVYRRLFKPSMMSTMAPLSYKVTEKGVIGSGGMSVFLHAKHLLNSNFVVNREKKYVEIDSTEAKYPYKIRLYAKDIDKLLDMLERVKRLELKRQSQTG
ncbi:MULTISPECIES: DUF2208 domain-containing protein [Metallosphaera]|uniref:Membrane protein n=3 Tax=Metallosphaera TaxID=41980 RepID=A0A088E2L1_9CREN|nr:MULTISPECIES: DUF2208 domain-containing protein [Metallosphaera]ABP94221.1 putative membrane protein [Metallosphaera sedula DSM 5348]AIM26208.1 putative membrane protein [Metallosphaera sedula]AKV73230.1 membrane protein [Metallosphaera sedula]AKV75474.1 membrane protein [Metallosphaera sedula]AKV77720.1 membrane protein [Metallosphaera sedula]